MFAFLTRPLTTDADARDYLAALVEHGMAYHPEDPAGEIIHSDTGRRLFTPEEATAADARMAEVYAVLNGDPCEVLEDLLGVGA